MSSKARRSGWTARRITAVAGGSVVGLIALATTAVGGLGISQALSAKDGYIDLGTASYSSDGYAVTSDPWNPAAGSYEKIEMRVTPASDAATFVGLARPGQVKRYLNDVAYTTLHRKDAGGAPTSRHDGSAPGTSPREARIWSAQAAGSGAQTLRWQAERGNWVVVAMNADGSPAVRGTVQLVATAPSMLGTSIGQLAGGVALLGGSVALIVVPIRRARHTGGSPATRSPDAGSST